jgi:hypothetical protein
MVNYVADLAGRRAHHEEYMSRHHVVPSAVSSAQAAAGLLAPQPETLRS